MDKVVLGEKEVVIGQSGCIRAKWWYSGKLILFGENWLY